jgi:hypothetical protein
MGLTGLAPPDAVIDMLEIFLLLDRASRAETSLFLFDTGTRSLYGKAVGDLFVAVHKTRAHPAEAEPDPFLPVHNPISGCSLLLQLLIGFLTFWEL